MIEDMMQDSMNMLDSDDVEDLADAEVDAVLFEITKGELGKAGKVPVRAPAVQVRTFRVAQVSDLMLSDGADACVTPDPWIRKLRMRRMLRNWRR